MNRFVWDLRTRPPAKLDAPPGADPMAQMMEQSVAPRVLPGDYRVQLTVGDTTLTQSFTVSGDPILAGKPAADLAAQFALATQITQSVDEINQALNQINRVRRQVDEWAGRAERAGRGERLAGPAEKLKQQLADIEGRLVVTQPEEPQGRPYQSKERLMALAAMLDESDDRPTRGMEEVYQALARQVEQELEQLDRVIGQEVAEFSRAIGDSGVAPIAP
jgi:small-conductance mechanosensitive channel